MKLLLEQVNSAGEVAGQAMTLEVVGGTGPSAYQTWLAQGNSGTEQEFLDSLATGGLPAEYIQAMNSAATPGLENPFMTDSATEASITEQRVDYDLLVATTLSI